MLNNWELIGHLGPIKYNNAATGGIAINKRVKKPDSNEYENSTIWFNYVVFGTLGQTFHKITKKGNLIRLVGECVIDEYKGEKRVKMIVKDFKLLYTPREKEVEETQKLPEITEEPTQTLNPDDLPF